MAGNDSLPVDSFLVSLEHFHTQVEVYDLIDHALAPGSGVTLHEVNKLGDHDYRISIHVVPARRKEGEDLVKSILERGLYETPRDVEITTDSYGAADVAKDTLLSTFGDITTALGKGAQNILGGVGLGTVAITVGVLALVVLTLRGRMRV